MDPKLDELYSFLRFRVSGFASGVDSWQGQERELEEDFVQETIVRTLEYSRRFSQSEVDPIQSIKSFSVRVMRNYREDRKRRDHRLLHFTQVNPSTEERAFHNYHIDPEEIVVEKVFREQLFFTLAAEIASFPAKQREALLIDLANLTDFTDKPTDLQRAFLAVGIRLQDYQQPLPTDPIARSRHSANLHMAYQRIASLACLQEYRAA